MQVHQARQPTIYDGEHQVCLVQEITLEQTEYSNARKYRVLDGNNNVRYFSSDYAIIKNDVETPEEAAIYKVHKYGDKDTYYYIHIPENMLIITIKS